MEGCIGSVVRSISGRDRKRVFVIVGVCNDSTGRVLVADGMLHSLSAPKKKNLRHLAVLAAAEAEETSFSLGTDEELYSFIKGFEKAEKEKIG
ncbi:MAG: KOW domain-containing RNA-binding protein [Clostridia bacterium]|nr:KOW domain-containing RNA-binding protein [Clostridia bacterium]